MKILSIYPGHNSTAAYFNDGVCECIFHEEKFTNVKNQIGFPYNAIDHIFSNYVPSDEIDFVIFPSTNQSMLHGEKESVDSSLIENFSRSKSRNILDKIEYKLPFQKSIAKLRGYVLEKIVTPKAWLEIENSLKSRYGIDKTQLVKVDHHLSHCLTPYYFYSLNKYKKDILLISLDGGGDGFFTKIYKVCDNAISFISGSSFNESLGLLYHETTKFLGMKPGEHEYKVMGLAAYVSDEKYFKHIYDELTKMIWLDKNKLEFRSAINMNLFSIYLKEKHCGERFDNVAAAVQKLTEDLVLEYIREAILQTGINSIAFSGGVFMNVKMNQKIVEMDEIDTVWFQPSAGDESLVIGAAAKFFLDHDVQLKSINTMYLGHSFTNDQVKLFLQEASYFDKYEIEYYDDIETKTAELLDNHKIVARFSGDAEWGARSLCNRAILANASDLASFYEINDAIKMRDFWMPFAPTILESSAQDYIMDWDSIRENSFESMKYMIVTSNSTALAQQHLRAAIHQKDKTLRAQIVTQESNSRLHKILSVFKDKTGMGGVMNTSFNMHGYPMVSTLEQAFFTFENSGLKYMTLENYLICKKIA